MINAIEEIYRQRRNLIIIGLTGRTGSGCSSVAQLLSRTIEDLNIEPYSLGENPENHKRKKYILYKFVERNWKPFFPILIRDVITSFLLQNSFKDFNDFLKENSLKPLGEDWQTEFESFSEKNKFLIKYEDEEVTEEVLYTYLENELTNFSNKFKKHLDEGSKQYYSLYQKLGDNIRKTGNALGKGENNYKHIYALVKRTENIINALRKYFCEKGRVSYFVVDSFRNPFEATYFHEKYTSYYLMAVNCPDDHRKDRLFNKLGLDKDEIYKLDEKEYPNKPPLESHDNFVSQNIGSCIQKADIHVNNDGLSDNKSNREILGQLFKYLSLILHPGLVTPSADEKMMQIAYTGKLNSGCISRQVGAVVTDKNGAIKGIGWNSTPEDQVPCLLRSAKFISNSEDDNSFSEYELKNEKIREQIEAHSNSYENGESLLGLNPSFCFKDIRNHIDENKNQVHTRSLHAEENAILQVVKYGGGALQYGTLYSTASPCELCSKKAFQLGLKRIVFIDPYPGTAKEQILMCGDKVKRPEVELFSGVIGKAYQKLYDPFLPYKDEINALATKPQPWQK